MILPCPSLVWELDDTIYFFLQLQRPYVIIYASVHRIEGEWKVG